jgi:hypothetical protein
MGPSPMRETGTASTRHPRIEDWPPLHRRAWEAAFVAGGLFDAPGTATQWRAASAKKTRLGYSAWLHWRLGQKDANAARIKASRPEDLISVRRFSPMSNNSQASTRP